MGFKYQNMLFIGDSITHDGMYVDFCEAYLRSKMPGYIGDLSKGGLSAETASGMTEPDRPETRPCVFSRLDALLCNVKPDLVVSLYGVNDGVYNPFSEDGFAAFKNGINKIREKAAEIGAHVCLLTPTWYDHEARMCTIAPDNGSYAYVNPYPGYGDVMQKYADWIMAQADENTTVVDIITPLKAIASVGDPKTRGDGVHPLPNGHWAMAKAVLKGLFGIEAMDDTLLENHMTDPFFTAIRKKNDILSSALRREPGTNLEAARELSAKTLEEALDAL